MRMISPVFANVATTTAFHKPLFSATLLLPRPISAMVILATALCSLTLLQLVVASKVDPLLFDKESGLDATFPPSIPARRDEYVPLGHLRCFGHQSYSSGRIKRIESVKPGKEFSDIVAAGEPVIMTDSEILSATISELSDDDLAATYGDLEIHYVPMRRHRPQEILLLDTLQSFLSSYRKRDEYLASTIPDTMRNLFPLPSYIQCGPYATRLLEAEMWMAWGGTGSLLHYHGDHQLHCMVDGRKDFVFIQGKYHKEMKCKETRPHSGEGVSSINMDMINMFAEQQIVDVPWHHITATKGQCVFIPAGYLHHVRSYGRALAFKIHFAPKSNSSDDSDSFSDCNAKSAKSDKTLNDYDFVWTLKNGMEQLANEKLTAETLTHILKVVSRGDEELSREAFDLFFNRAIAKAQNSPIDAMKLTQRVFNYLDKEEHDTMRFGFLLMCLIVATHGQQSDTSIEDFLRLTIENFRGQMKTGIPEIGMPPLDPLRIPIIDININDGVANLRLKITDLVCKDISNFDLRSLHLDMGTMALSADIFFPGLKADAQYYLDGTVMGFIPLYGSGGARLGVNNLHISLNSKVDITSGKLYLQTFGIQISFSQITVNLENILGGGDLAEVVNTVISSFGKQIFDSQKGNIEWTLNNVIRNALNYELAKIDLGNIVYSNKDSEIQPYYSPAEANAFLDLLLANLRPMIAQMEPFALPALVENFPGGFIAFNYGYLSGLSSILRTDDFLVQLDSNTGILQLAGSVGVTNILVAYQMTVLFLGITYYPVIRGIIHAINVFINVLINMNTGQKQVAQLTITAMSTPDLILENLPPVIGTLASLIMSLAMPAITNTLKGVFQVEIWNLIQAELNKLPFP